VAEPDPQQLLSQTQWARDLQHRPDPNRVTRTQEPIGPPRAPSSTPLTVGPGAGTVTSRPPAPPPQDRKREPSYYDVSLLKAPPWKWEIAWYFYLGGMSAGAYTIARLAERAGGEKYREISRTGAYVSLLSFLPCPPLLIHDLGDPKRFHHMMRVFKPTSPMNLGTWSILGYSGMSAVEALRQWMLDKHPPHRRSPTVRRTMGALELAHDAAGIPFALLVAGYTGVLLSTSSNPLWSKNKWLGPLFSASAVATGAAATSLALSLASKGGGKESSHRALEKIDTAAHVAEAACLVGYLKQAGPNARPLVSGRMKGHLGVTIGGLVLGEILKLLPFRGALRRMARSLSAIVSLLSGFSLRWAMVHGGHDAANDPHLARLATGSKSDKRLSAAPPKKADEFQHIS
jgi:formate-dependent nitrite reductase membrane component NrfD